MRAIGTKPLRTKRLLLRAPEAGDAPALTASGSLTMPVAEAEAALAQMAAEAEKPYVFHWVIEHGGEAIGRIKGWEVSQINGYVQLGYDIAPEMRGHGYMTEAVGAVIRYLLTQADANRVYCSVRAHNIASCRVCEKNGMQLEGLMRQHYSRADGGYDDVRIYGILKSDLIEGKCMKDA